MGSFLMMNELRMCSLPSSQFHTLESRSLACCINPLGKDALVREWHVVVNDHRTQTTTIQRYIAFESAALSPRDYNSCCTEVHAHQEAVRGLESSILDSNRLNLLAPSLGLRRGWLNLALVSAREAIDRRSELREPCVSVSAFLASREVLRASAPAPPTQMERGRRRLEFDTSMNAKLVANTAMTLPRLYRREEHNLRRFAAGWWRLGGGGRGLATPWRHVRLQVKRDRRAHDWWRPASLHSACFLGILLSLALSLLSFFHKPPPSFFFLQLSRDYLILIHPHLSLTLSRHWFIQSLSLDLLLLPTFCPPFEAFPHLPRISRPHDEGLHCGRGCDGGAGERGGDACSVDWRFADFVWQDAGGQC